MITAWLVGATAFLSELVSQIVIQMMPCDVFVYVSEALLMFSHCYYQEKALGSRCSVTQQVMTGTDNIKNIEISPMHWVSMLILQER